jgi:tripartite-type tricarboxylate transporter receptor subunit TctC
MEGKGSTGKVWGDLREGKTGYESRQTGNTRTADRILIKAGMVMIVMLLLGASMTAPLSAQTYPNKPIRFIIPFPAGGASDILARIIGQKLSDRLGQPVVPENRGGAGGNVGIESVAKSKPDGYTIVLSAPAIAISPSLYKKLNYDPIKELAPISLVAEVPNLVLIRPSLPVKNMKEFIEYAKANPGKLQYGASGIGASSHLATVLLTNLAKMNILEVRYKGSAQAMIGMMGNEVDMMVIGPPAAMPQIQAGKVKAVAVLSKERLPYLPDVPTIRESGIDNCEVTTWYGILAPAGTPREIIQRLNAEWIKIVAMPDTIEKMKSAGTDPISSTPEQFTEFIKTETVRWARVIKEANLTVE